MTRDIDKYAADISDETREKILTGLEEEPDSQGFQMSDAQDHHRDACLDNHTEEGCAAIQLAAELERVRQVVQHETKVAPGWVWARISRELGWE